MPSPGKWILGALVLNSLTSCGGDGSNANEQTCIAIIVTYSGSKSGAAYVRVRESDGGSLAVNAPSIELLILSLEGSTFCARYFTPHDNHFTAAAWIDVSGNGAASCSDLAAPQCQPLPGDPQGQASGVERYGQLTKIQLDIVDPL